MRVGTKPTDLVSGRLVAEHSYEYNTNTTALWEFWSPHYNAMAPETKKLVHQNPQIELSLVGISF